MKTMFVVLVLTLGWLVSNGQLYPPIQPYQENDYSISQVERFALASTELSSNWRKELLEIVNNGLAEAGENMILDESSIYWILDHVTYERRKLNSFTNSRRIGGKIDFFSDRSNFDGMVGVFNYGKCSLILYKTKCMNLLKNTGQQYIQKVPDQVIPEQKVKTDVKISAFNFPEDLGGVIVDTKVPNLNLNLPPAPKERGKIKVWIFVIPIAAIIGGTVYLLTKKKNSQPLIEPRTMPPGIPAVEPQTTPGLPSDPRTMPAGIPATPVPTTPGLPSDSRGMPSGTGG